MLNLAQLFPFHGTGLRATMDSVRNDKAGHIRLLIYSATFLSVLFLFMFYLDEMVIAWIMRLKEEGSPFMSLVKSVDPAIDFLSHGLTIITASVLVYIYGRFFHRKLAEVGMALIMGYLASGIGAQVLKHLLGRARPRITAETVFIGPSLKSSYDSFVSGHAAVAFCVAFILSHYYPKYRVLFYTFAVLTALGRLDSPSHFPSDLLGGAVFGLLAAWVIMRMGRRGLPKAARPQADTGHL